MTIMMPPALKTPVAKKEVETKHCSDLALKSLAILIELKHSHPNRLSVHHIKDSVAHALQQSAGLDGLKTRTIQRSLNCLEQCGLIYGDGEMPQGWRFTDESKRLFVQKTADADLFSSEHIHRINTKAFSDVTMKLVHLLVYFKHSYPSRKKTSDLHDALSTKCHISHRTTQRLLGKLEVFGLIERSCYQANETYWRLSPAGCQLLNVEVQS